MSRPQSSTLDPFSLLWRFFASVKLAITLISSILLSCVIGSVIQQWDQVDKPLSEIYSPSTLKMLEFFGLTDLYHSSWFVALIALLAINLTVCSIDRLPKVWKAASRIPPALDLEKELKSTSLFFKHIQIKKDPQALQKGIQNWITQMRHTPHLLKETQSGWQLFFHRGLISKQAVWLIHTSLLTIMAGGVWGAFNGFEGLMNIPEGETISYFKQIKGDTDLFQDSYEYGKRVSNFRTLPFQVELERFDLQFWEGHPNRPKAFKSKLNVYENGKKVHTQIIDVNEPLTWKGVTFYQASYGEAGPGAFHLIFLNKDKRERRDFRELKIGESFIVTDEYKNKPISLKVTLTDYNKSFQPGPMNLGPSVKLKVEGDPSNENSPKKPQEFWIMKNFPLFDLEQRKTNFYFVFQEHEPKWFTGLQLARDPGALLVWIGAFFLLIGVWTALFVTPQRYWVVYENETLYLKGIATRSKLDFEKLYQKIFNKMVVAANLTS